MEKVLYRSHLIDARAERTACLDYWIPVARVSRDETGAPRQSVIGGHFAWCKNEDEATLYALTTAKRWIDDRARKSDDIAATIRAAGETASASGS